jgi:hypothetical protein
MNQGLLIIFYKHNKKKTLIKKTPNWLSSSNVLFINSKRQQRANAHYRLFLFCLCAPREDEDKLTLVIFSCFVSMHLKKMMTS